VTNYDAVIIGSGARRPTAAMTLAPVEKIQLGKIHVKLPISAKRWPINIGHIID